MARPVARVVVALVAGMTVSGCFGDPPPDPATAPVEVVLPGCVLNRDSIAVGTHELSTVGEGAVVVTGPAGDVVGQSSGTTTPSNLVIDAPGTYVVSCQPSLTSAPSASSELEVVAD